MRTYLAGSILLLEEGLLEPVLLVLDLVQVLQGVEVVVVVLVEVDDQFPVRITNEWLCNLLLCLGLVLAPLNEVLELLLVGELVHFLNCDLATSNLDLIACEIGVLFISRLFETCKICPRNLLA